MAQSTHPKMQPLDDATEALIDAAREMGPRAAQTKSKRAGKATRSGSVAGESPLWDELRGRVERQLAKRGEQSLLARFLGVSRQRVHQMIQSRSGQPNAERTLLLFAWVVARERGQKLA